MAYPAKLERNKELYSKRKKDPQKWTIRALGSHYQLNERTVWDIVKWCEKRENVSKS